MQSDIIKTLLGLASQTGFTIILEQVEPKTICCSVNSWKGKSMGIPCLGFKAQSAVLAAFDNTRTLQADVFQGVP